ncbi:MAG: foldase protein PrsA, partial [Planctomycetota bacterium]
LLLSLAAGAGAGLPAPEDPTPTNPATPKVATLAAEVPIDANAEEIRITYKGVPGSQSARTREEALQMAAGMCRQLQKEPGKFEQFVKLFSEAPDKAYGGAVGPFRGGRMSPSFAQAVFSLPIGAIGNLPVETPYGFHIVKRIPMPAVYFGRFILVSWSGADLAAAYRTLLTEDAARSEAESLYTALQAHPENFRATMMDRSDDPGKAAGGYLPDFYPGRADPALVAAAASVPIDGIAAPIRTRYGYLIFQRLALMRDRPVLHGVVAGLDILIAYKGAAGSSKTRSWADARARATTLAAEARAHPEKFVDLSAAQSDAANRDDGGNLGLIDLTQLSPVMYDWGATLQGLAVGAVGGPVEAPDGFHVLLRTQLPDRLHARQILVAWKGTPSKVVRDKATAAAQAAEYLARLRAAPPAEREENFIVFASKYSDDVSVPGGDLGTFRPQDYFPAVAKALLQTPIGGLTGVVETPFGYAILLRLAPTHPLPEETHPVNLNNIRPDSTPNPTGNPHPTRGPGGPGQGGPAN